MERNILGNAVRVLERLSGSAEPIGVRELSRVLEMPVGSTHRLLQALVRERLVAQVGKRGLYRIGSRVAELGSNLSRSHDLVPVGLPILREMAERSSESGVIMVCDGLQAASVASVEGDQLLRVVFPVGWRGPLYRGAAGKVLLAFQPEDEIEAVIREGLRARAPARLANAAQLRSKLAEIRRTGCAVSYGERLEGFSSAAAAIRGPDQAVIASVALFGPFARFSRSELARHLSLIRSCAARITEALGERWSSGRLPVPAGPKMMRASGGRAASRLR